MRKLLPLIALVLINLIVGLYAVPAFGESVDELSQHSYAERTLQAVQLLFQTQSWPAYFSEEEPKQASHGPAFIMSVLLLRNLFVPEGTVTERLIFSHLLYFLAFQLGILSFFFLARRWMSETAALVATVLLNTQPVLTGHAFMNPKDVVFMSFLTASAALGLWMVDRGENVSRATTKPFSGGIRAVFEQFRYADVWLAGLMLGFASAIRFIAPLVGLVILVYGLLSRKWHSIPRLFAYGVVAFFFMILFWPYLWPDPIGRLISSALHSANYPDTHVTLFRGALYDARNIPLSYLPVLLLVQLTETALLLILAGVFRLLKKVRWDLMSLILIWFALPAGAIVLLRVNLYDNFRQVFFILPPLFLLAGLGLDWLLILLQPRLLRYSLIVLILFPGLYANLQLYPYQYVYYNQLIGGLKGAFREFELDYWRLSYREAQIYINQTAEFNADILVGNAKPSAQTFARPDLVFNAFSARRRNWEKYDYIIVSTAENEDEKFAEYPTVFTIERDGVPLVYVKKIQ